MNSSTKDVSTSILCPLCMQFIPFTGNAEKDSSFEIDSECSRCGKTINIKGKILPSISKVTVKQEK